MFKKIAEPGRLIISLALLFISLPLMFLGETTVSVLLIASVGGAWGIRIVNGMKPGGPS